MCVTEVENNLIAMGFEVTSDGAVAQLPDIPTRVEQFSRSTQVSVKSAGSDTSRAVASKPIAPPSESKVVGGAAVTGAKVLASAVSDGPQHSLYKIIRQRSHMKVLTQEEQSKTLSSDAEDSVVTRSGEEDSDQHPHHEPSVKFCLENNAFISASSAEESQCR